MNPPGKYRLTGTGDGNCVLESFSVLVGRSRSKSLEEIIRCEGGDIRHSCSQDCSGSGCWWTNSGRHNLSRRS